MSGETYAGFLVGVDPDDPAAREIARAAAQLKLLYDIDVRESPELMAKAIERGRRVHAAQQSIVPPEGREPVVYYVRIGQLVKIGTTGQLAVRLKAFPPDAVLLATEPGGMDLETERHRQFAATAVTKHSEYFYPSAPMVDHINSLRTQPLSITELA